MSKISGFASYEEKKELKDFAYSVDTLQPFDVQVKVTHCGICHSDVHLIDNDWKVSQYPFIPGHEIVGIVTKIGEAVKHLKIGERVGFGWQASSCLQCEWCLKGEENLCEHYTATCVKHHGGFADGFVGDSRFAFVIPENLHSENAAPLLCGGITVYSPFRRLAIKPTMKVGIVGVGGLGHLALQFANKWGCEVTAFSTTASKEKEAKSFGAHHFVLSSNVKRMKEARGSLDIVLSTVSGEMDWKAWLKILGNNGKLVVVGASPSDISVSTGDLIGPQKSIVGSCIGGRSTIEEMLSFAARHKIQAQTELMPLKKVNEALARVRANKARYRIVLDCQKS